MGNIQELENICQRWMEDLSPDQREEIVGASGYSREHYQSFPDNIRHIEVRKDDINEVLLRLKKDTKEITT